jgi:hypothetical protein
VPLGLDRLRVNHLLATQVVATLWPFFSAACGTPEGRPFGFAIATRELVLFDPFYRGLAQCGNVAILGEQGAGKSFATRLMLLGLLADNGSCIIVDTVGDYAFFAKTFGSELCTHIKVNKLFADQAPPQFDKPMIIFDTSSLEDPILEHTTIYAVAELILRQFNQEVWEEASSWRSSRTLVIFDDIAGLIQSAAG